MRLCSAGLLRSKNAPSCIRGSPIAIPAAGVTIISFKLTRSLTSPKNSENSEPPTARPNEAGMLSRLLRLAR